MTPFSAWLLKQADRDDPVGDLARDAKADAQFPRTNSIQAIEFYLRLHGCYEATQALKRAIREWTAETAK